MIKPVEFIRDLNAYSVTSQDVWRLNNNDDCLKLDWNESVKAHRLVKKAIIDFIASNQGAIKWYPDVEAANLREALSDFLNVSRLEISIFGGSDVALETVIRTYVSKGDIVLLITPSYDNFRVYAESTGASIKRLYFNPIDQDCDFLETLNGLKSIPKVIYLNNPNNPIGYFIEIEKLRVLLEKFENTLIIVDEAYIEFKGKQYSTVSLVQEYKNLIVARSFSKAFGLAGLRLGYIVSNRINLRYVNKIRNGKNISMFAQIAGKVLLENYSLIEDYISEVNRVKNWFVEELVKFDLSAIRSEANFVLVEVDKPQEVMMKLKQNKIFVRDRSHMQGLENMIRITIGDMESMKRTLQAIKKIII